MKRHSLLLFGTVLLAGLAAGAELDELYRSRTGTSHRVSSYNPAGANRDYVVLQPDERRDIARIPGSGIIRHLWFTLASKDALYLRNTLLRFYWDGGDKPAVDLPIGDLFGLGHGIFTDIDSAPISVVRSPKPVTPAGAGALNLYLPMPFRRGARIEVENRSALPVDAFFFQVDYESRPVHEPLRFHAAAREQALQAAHEPNNLTGKDNYVVLDTRGRGHYIGCVLSVDSRGADPGKWWEGDDMIFVDDEPWPPRLHGTGTEDYFSLAWGFRRVVMRPYFGITLVEKRPGIDTRYFDGLFTAYRFHVMDPIAFRRSIRVTLEHGTGNDAAVRYRSTAYWYASGH